MKTYFSALIILIAVLVAGCQSKPITGETVTLTNGSYRSITANELNRMSKDKDFVLINVHIPFAGNIPGTDLSIPYDQIENSLPQLPTDKNAKIVSYCRSGHMSKIAAEKLVSLGYTNIWNLSGGMADWEKAGYQIEK
jgi:rhodanese-related sulfurtransferase